MLQRVVVCFMVGFGVTASTGIADEVVIVPEPDEEVSPDIIEEFEVLPLIGSGCSSSLSPAEKRDPDEGVLSLLDKGRSFAPSRRIEAAYELYETGIETGDEVDAVKAWLDREDEPWARRYLVMTLLDLDDEIFMVEMLASQDPETRSIVAKYMVESVDIGVGLESILIEVYRPDDPWWARVPFLAAFSEGIRDDSLRILHEALEDKVRDVRGAAIVALEEREDPRSLDHLLSAMEDPDLIGADTPLEGIASMSDASLIPWIEEAAGSESPAVREEAANALGNLCARGSEKVLRALLDDPHRTVVHAAAGALEKFGIEESTDGNDSRSHRFLDTSLETLAPEARIVVPPQGETAEAWEVAPGLKYDESPSEVSAGSIAVVEDGALYRGETWLLVSIQGEGLDGWMRERDLRRLTRQEALAIVNGASR